MNLFETVKTAISVGQAAKRYGLTVGKNGMCCCPFHADKTPSMKLNEAYYYCFGCKAHGDVIALTAQLLHLPPGSAAAELTRAFHVDISACQGRGKERRRQHYQPDTVALAHQLAAIREKGTDRERDAWLRHAQKVLTTYLRLLRTWKERYAPRPGEDVWHPVFQEACQREAWVEDLLAQSDDPLERDFLYDACKKEVDAMRNESPGTNREPPMSQEGLDASYAAIREALEKNNRGNVVNSLQNCVLALTHDPLLGGHIRRNLFNERLTIDCPLPWVRESSVISDTDLAFLQLHLERHYGLKAERCLPGALKIAATDNAFHPVRDRLRALRWDGVPRVRNALHHFLGAEVNDYHERCLRTFMLGAVKRVFQPGCKFELMLVLVGSQGAGKSTFLRSLAMEPDWFSDDLRNLSDKDVFHRLNGRWIIEMSEMVATANARSIEEIKAFLSRDRDFCRLAYDRFGADHPRQCVFAGATNRMDFLPMDRSGNRRFLPVQVDASKADCHILDDPEASRAYFEQMWAEIMAQYDSGAYTTYLSKAEETTLLHEQEAFAQEDTLAGRIYHYMDQFQGDKLCTMQIFKEGLDHMFDEPKAYETREIREIVDEGIRRGEIKGWRRYENNRRFAKYGRQRGWERMIPEKAPEPQQLAFVVVDEPDLPWKDETEGQQSLPER